MSEKFSYPKTSIVISTYNNAKTLEKTLNGMLKLDYPSEYEVIVVNDGSSDNTKEMLGKKFGGNKKIKIINLPRSGVCKARNTGIKATRFPYVVNMDHDCIPKKDWLKDVMIGFSSSKVGVVSAYDYYGGTSTAFRKNLLDKVGGYDEDYFYYREDTDLSFKIMDLGYEFKLVEAEYEHDHKMTKPKGFSGLVKHVYGRLKNHMNDVLLYKKHPTKLCREFLHIKYSFLVSPMQDFKVATGLWEREKPMKLSSPRGITFIENKSPLHAVVIVLMGILYVLAVKLFRLAGSIQYGKLLI